MTSHIGTGGARLRATLVVLATALGFGFGLVLAGSAQASTVDCKGGIVPTEGASSVKAFTYDISCTSPQGIPEQPTQIDAFSIVSTKGIGGFGANVLVFDPTEAVVPDQAFGCEGPIPGAGFGCSGKGGLGNTAVGSFSLRKNPCSKRALKQPWKVWAVVASDKINEATSARTKQVSEPFKLPTPKCAAPQKGGKRH